MDSGIIIIGAVLIGGFIAFRFFMDNQSNTTKHSKKQGASSRSTSSSLLYQARKDDNKPIRSDEVTLIANSRFARDEIMGTVDLIEGHHPVPPDYIKSDVIRTWTYIGDHNMSFNTEFKKEIQSIILDMKSENWSAESAPNSGKKEIWLLTR